MRLLFVAMAAVSLLVSGCATQRQVAQAKGTGARQVYSAPYERVWAAAVDAAQLGELEVQSVDKSSGYIAARRGMQLETFGENVGVWITRLGPNETEVEVKSRQAGPPRFWLKNWEDEIHNAIAANLTRFDKDAPQISSSPAPARVLNEPAGASADVESRQLRTEIQSQAPSVTPPALQTPPAFNRPPAVPAAPVAPAPQVNIDVNTRPDREVEVRSNGKVDVRTDKEVNVRTESDAPVAPTEGRDSERDLDLLLREQELQRKELEHRQELERERLRLEQQRQTEQNR
jgi:hypothetical protein